MENNTKTTNRLTSQLDEAKLELYASMLGDIEDNAGRLYAALEDNLTDDAYRLDLLDRIDSVQELTIEIKETFDDAIAEHGYTVDDSGDYPVLHRGKVKAFEWVHISSIETDKIPLNKKALDTAGLVKARMPVVPLQLMEKVGKTSPKYKLCKGEYYFQAFKLNEIDWVPVQIHSEFTGIIHKTGEKFKEVFKKLS